MQSSTQQWQLSAENLKLHKRNVKTIMNKISIALLGYLGIQTLVLLVLLIGVALAVFLKKPELLKDPESQRVLSFALSNWINTSGIPAIVPSAFGMLSIVIFRRRRLLDDIKRADKSMNASIFWRFFLCVAAPQLVFIALNMLAEPILNLFGYTIQATMDAITGGSSTFSRFLYVAIIGPVLEEIIFRGAVLRSLEPYGKSFAIILSAFMFGVFHGHPLQGIYAFFVGLVLGYVAIEYSIKWAMLLHITNNMVLAEFLSWVVKKLPLFHQSLLGIALLILYITGCVLIFAKRRSIQAYLRYYVSWSGTYRFALTSVATVVFMIVYFFFALNWIKPITP